MTTHIVCAHDGLNERPELCETIRHACEGWAHIDFLPQPTDAASEEAFRTATLKSDIVIGWPHPEWVLESRARFFQCGSTGYEKYQGKGLETKPHFVMCNSAGTMTIPVAEHGIALMLANSRRIYIHAVDTAKRKFERNFPYREVWETTACVCGLGAIGTKLATLCKGLGMRVIGIDLHDNPIAEKVYPLERMGEAFAQADHIFVVLPLTAQTRGCINSATLAQAKDGAALYALARGAHYVEQDVADALKSGKLSFAGLDVFTEEPLSGDSPLWDAPNCLITPHASGRSTREFARFAALIVENLEKFRKGEPLRNTVMKTA